ARASSASVAKNPARCEVRRDHADPEVRVMRSSLKELSMRSALRTGYADAVPREESGFRARSSGRTGLVLVAQQIEDRLHRGEDLPRDLDEHGVPAGHRTVPQAG